MSTGELGGLMPALTPSDIFRGIVPVELGGQRFELPALSIEEDEEWARGLDGRLRGLLEGVREGENDQAAILAILTGANDQLLDALYAYDKSGVLPPRDGVKRLARAIDVLRGALTVWMSTNPTLAAALAAVAAETNGTLPARTSSRPSNGAGRRARSAKAG